MKISMIGKIYPVILKKVIAKQLKIYYTKEEIKNILPKVKYEYHSVIAHCSELGGKDNFFIDNIYLGAYVVAVYKTTSEKIDLKQFDKLVANALDSMYFFKKRMQKRNFLSKEYRGKLEKASKWCKEKEDVYPENWQVEVVDTRNDKELRFQFTKCGLYYMCQNENVSELIPILCKMDFVIYGYGGCDLERNETLSNGNERCLFAVTEKKI